MDPLILPWVLGLVALAVWSVVGVLTLPSTDRPALRPDGYRGRRRRKPYRGKRRADLVEVRRQLAAYAGAVQGA